MWVVGGCRGASVGDCEAAGGVYDGDDTSSNGVADMFNGIDSEAFERGS